MSDRETRPADPARWPGATPSLMARQNTLLGDMFGADVTELGAYCRLVAVSWARGSIDASPDSLARMFRCPRRKAEKLWQRLEFRFIETASGRYTLPWLEMERAETMERLTKRDRVRVARALSPKKRARIMERDGFRCRRCGRGPDEVALAVDHVVPVVRGGGASAANLQTLCVDCNIGKGRHAPHAHDLRPTEVFG